MLVNEFNNNSKVKHKKRLDAYGARRRACGAVSM
jgi:hypothetical protein